MKTKVLFMFMAAILFIGCKPTSQPFTPVSVEAQEIYIKWINEDGVTTPAAPEVRVINSVQEYLSFETEFNIGQWVMDTLKVPISDIDFTTQQIVVVYSERSFIFSGTPLFSIQFDKAIEYENYIECSIRKIIDMTSATGRSVMFILMPKTSKTIQTEWFFGERV